MEFDPKALVPDSDEEKDTWHGHSLGMRAALHCLAMYERSWDPESAGAAVDQHIVQAVTILRRRFLGESAG